MRIIDRIQYNTSQAGFVTPALALTNHHQMAAGVNGRVYCRECELKLTMGYQI